MNITGTTIAGVVIVDTQSVKDPRGQFTRLYCERELSAVLAGRRIMQINHSVTHVAGTVRGLHYQNPPYAEMKLVRCLRGKVWDIAVDLRQDSPTFLTWVGRELSAKNKEMLVIPEGCAHGFQALEENSELLYLHTELYRPDAEGGIAYNDPRLSIGWPLPVSEMSARDSAHSPLPADFKGFAL